MNPLPTPPEPSDPELASDAELAADEAALAALFEATAVAPEPAQLARLAEHAGRQRRFRPVALVPWAGGALALAAAVALVVGRGSPPVAAPTAALSLVSPPVSAPASVALAVPSAPAPVEAEEGLEAEALALAAGELGLSLDDDTLDWASEGTLTEGFDDDLDLEGGG